MKRKMVIALAYAVSVTTAATPIISYAAEPIVMEESTVFDLQSTVKHVTTLIQNGNCSDALHVLLDTGHFFEAYDALKKDIKNLFLESISEKEAYALETCAKYELLNMLIFNNEKDLTENDVDKLLSYIDDCETILNQKQDLSLEEMEQINKEILAYLTKDEIGNMENLEDYLSYLQSTTSLEVFAVMQWLNEMDDTDSEKSEDAKQSLKAYVHEICSVKDKDTNDTVHEESNKEVNEDTKKETTNEAPHKESVNTSEKVSYAATERIAGSWIQDSATGKWWYKHTDGSYTKNDWEFIDGKWYYFDESGWMVTGWKFINNNWFYFDTSGAMATNQWIDNNYVNSSGYWTKAKVSTNGNFKQAVETEAVTEIFIVGDFDMTDVSNVPANKKLTIYVENNRNITRTSNFKGRFLMIPKSASVSIKVSDGAGLTLDGKQVEGCQTLFWNEGTLSISGGKTVIQNTKSGKYESVGIVNAGGNITIDSVTFQSNTTSIEYDEVKDNGTNTCLENYGGGVAKISNCEFSDNYSYSSLGAIINGIGLEELGWLDNATMHISNTVFSGNTARLNTGVIRNNSRSKLYINGCSFLGNKTEEGMGGVLWIGSEKPDAEKPYMRIENSVFDGNSSGGSGGVLVSAYGKVDISNSEFLNNKAGTNTEKGDGQSAGVIWLGDYNNELNIDGCLFEKNSAKAHSGALFVGESIGDPQNQIKAKVTNSTFHENESIDGGGGAISSMGELLVEDSIFTKNAALWGGAINNTSIANSAIIKNSTFNENAISSGGGGAILNEGTLSIMNSEMNGNISTQKSGSAIYVSTLGRELNISGDFYANDDNDIYLAPEKFIHVVGALTNPAEKVARITVPDYFPGRKVVEVDFADKKASEMFERFSLTPKENFLIRPGDYIVD